MNIKEIKKALIQIQGECFLPTTDKEEISTMIEDLLYEIDNSIFVSTSNVYNVSKIKKVKD